MSTSRRMVRLTALVIVWLLAFAAFLVGVPWQAVVGGTLLYTIATLVVGLRRRRSTPVEMPKAEPVGKSSGATHESGTAS